MSDGLITWVGPSSPTSSAIFDTQSDALIPDIVVIFDHQRSEERKDGKMELFRKFYAFVKGGSVLQGRNDDAMGLVVQLISEFCSLVGEVGLDEVEIEKVKAGLEGA